MAWDSGDWKMYDSGSLEVTTTANIPSVIILFTIWDWHEKWMAAVQNSLIHNTSRSTSLLARAIY